MSHTLLKFERALATCTAAAVFFGQTGQSPYQNQEVQQLLNTRGLTGLRIIPVLLPGAPETVITGLLRSRTWVQFNKTLEQQEAYGLLLCGIRGVRPGEASLESEAPRIKPSGQCPNRG